MAKQKIKVLMTGGGAPGGAGVIRCLQADKRIELHVGDANPTATGRFLNPHFIQLPLAESENFVSFLLDYCQNNQINVVFPLVTRELLVLSDAIEQFKKSGIHVIVSEKTSLAIANNKARLYEHLSANKILTPQYQVVAAGDFEGFLAATSALGFPEKPFVMKPAVSNGSRGIRIVDNSVNRFDLLFDQKPNSLYADFSELSKILRGQNFPELLISEMLTGEEYTIDTLVGADGKAKLVLPRIRLKMNNGISTEGQFIENQEVINYSHQIINSLNLFGLIGIQVKKAADGQFKILEINPRVQGTSVATMGLGINLPLLAVQQSLGEPLSMPPINWGKRFVRYWQEAFF